MKKIVSLLFALLVCAALTAVAFAEEIVVYENDFSDPATIADFKQYRIKWEIRDGALWLTDEAVEGSEGINVSDTFAHIIWQSTEKLTDYIAEVDVYNVQTSSGLIFRADQDKVSSDGDSSFYGYLAFIANAGDKGALGCAGEDGKWKSNINVGGVSDACTIGSNVHIKVVAEGKKINVLITNIDTGAEVYAYSFLQGLATQDAGWTNGTVGLRLRSGYAATGVSSVGTAHFDNLKITKIVTEGAATEATTEATTTEATTKATEPVVTEAPKPIVTEAPDKNDPDLVYYNDFSDPATIADFKQYIMEWEIRDGALWLTDKLDEEHKDDNLDETFTHIIWQAPERLTDFIAEVDIYNVQTSSGLIFRADQDRVTNESANSFYGYLAFIANAGDKGVLGCASDQGTWKGNINVGSVSDACTIGSNVHLKVTANGKKLSVEVTNLDTGAVAYTFNFLQGMATQDEGWASGTVGLRLRAGYAATGVSSVGTVHFDNLKITKIAQEETTAKTETTTKAPEVTTEKTTEKTAETTKAPEVTTEKTVPTSEVTTATPAPAEESGNIGLIIGIIAAVVVIAVIVVIVLLKKKKK